MSNPSNPCQHEDFNASVTCNRIVEDGLLVMVDLKIVCSQCGTPVVFLGLPRGVDMKGATMNTDGTEARLATVMKGDAAPELPLGFHQRKQDPQ